MSCTCSYITTYTPVSHLTVCACMHKEGAPALKSNLDLLECQCIGFGKRLMCSLNSQIIDDKVIFIKS